MLDVFLAIKAHEEEKQVHPIETTEEQCNPIRSLTQQQIIFAINYTTTYLEHLHIAEKLFTNNTESSLSALVKGYKCGKLDEHYLRPNMFRPIEFEAGEEERALAHKIEQQLREDIIAKRNERMANRLSSFFSRNPHLTIFSAFGSGHFFGNDSVLHHLKRMGYTIQNVRENDAIAPPPKPRNKYKFNSLWMRDKPAVSKISVEIIEENLSSATLYFFVFISLANVY
ncbi:hypothetical protein OESDEN_00844 [Oesophagostomum dentatum]|uniref:Metalloprotease TIKI homolog n=1 Tax=Oesophagostomum dentatum TaxID=61180 RepID=A0A0B1TTP6_OESDE|nr:hypothetical protein OESDEN_00844 [Oesophagostomum dentatum]